MFHSEDTRQMARLRTVCETVWTHVWLDIYSRQADFLKLMTAEAHWSTVEALVQSLSFRILTNKCSWAENGLISGIWTQICSSDTTESIIRGRYFLETFAATTAIKKLNLSGWCCCLSWNQLLILSCSFTLREHWQNSSVRWGRRSQGPIQLQSPDRCRCFQSSWTGHRTFLYSWSSLLPWTEPIDVAANCWK